MKKITLRYSLGIFGFTVSLASADSISVNFHADDVSALAEHQIGLGEVAGLRPIGDWNNINVGEPAVNRTGQIIALTALTDDQGNASAAMIESSVDSSWFVGYAASVAGVADELELEGNDDDLFNSYLALNGPSGDGSPSDLAVLNITGLGANFTDGGYRLIIYSDSDRGPANATPRTSVFTITPEGGNAISRLIEDDGPLGVAAVTFSGEYIESDNSDDDDDYSNYTVIEGLSSESFTLEVTSPDGGRGAISGFQIITNTEEGLTIRSIRYEVDGGAPSATLAFSSVVNQSYAIDYSTTLRPGEWFELADNVIATSDVTEFTDDIMAPMNPQELFYRVRLE